MVSLEPQVRKVDAFNLTTRYHNGKLLFLSDAGVGTLRVIVRDAELALQYVQFAAITFRVIF